MKFQNQRWEGICLGSQHPLKQRSKNLHLNLKQSSHTPENSSISFMPKTSHQNTWNGLPYCNVSMDRTSGVVQESSNTSWLDGTRYASLLRVWKLTTFNHSLFGKWFWRKQIVELGNQCELWGGVGWMVLETCSGSAVGRTLAFEECIVLASNKNNELI